MAGSDGVVRVASIVAVDIKADTGTDVAVDAARLCLGETAARHYAR